ncbi:hypothetical protein [Pseudomonas paralcaligenes]|nr:hypothetical protein [Pseudomonas paralcaligenes]
MKYKNVARKYGGQLRKFGAQAAVGGFTFLGGATIALADAAAAKAKL